MPTSAHIDVLIPTHGHAAVVGATLASLQEQTEESFRAFVLDDGSEDGTFEAAREAVAGDDRFVIERQEASGTVATLNALASRAQAPYVALLAAGDAWAPRRLAWGVQDLEEDSGRAAAFCAYRVGAEPPSANGGAGRGVAAATATADSLAQSDRSLIAQLTVSNCLAASTAMIRGEALHHASPFARDLQTMHGWDLWLRLSLVGSLHVRRDVGATLKASTTAASEADNTMQQALTRAQLIGAAHEQLQILEEMAPKMIARHGLPQNTWGQVHAQMAMHAMTMGDAQRALTHLATKAKHDGLLQQEQMWLLRCFIATNRLGPARDLANVLHSGHERLSAEMQAELTALSKSAGWAYPTMGEPTRPQFLARDRRSRDGDATPLYQ